MYLELNCRCVMLDRSHGLHLVAPYEPCKRVDRTLPCLKEMARVGAFRAGHKVLEPCLEQILEFSKMKVLLN
jgi:hypothetical protein